MGVCCPLNALLYADYRSTPLFSREYGSSFFGRGGLRLVVYTASIEPLPFFWVVRSFIQNNKKRSYSQYAVYGFKWAGSSQSVHTLLSSACTQKWSCFRYGSVYSPVQVLCTDRCLILITVQAHCYEYKVQAVDIIHITQQSRTFIHNSVLIRLCEQALCRISVHRSEHSSDTACI